MGCFDVVSTVLDEAARQIGNGCYENDVGKRMLKNTCEMIDLFMEQSEADGCEVDVDIDGDDKDIIISVICPLIQFYDTDSVLFDILERAKRLSFSSYDEDNLRISFVFDGILCATDKEVS